MNLLSHFKHVLAIFMAWGTLSILPVDLNRLQAQEMPTDPLLWSIRMGSADVQNPDYEEALRACDQALSDADRVIETQNAIIELQAKQVELAVKRAAELEARLNAFWRSPMFNLGLGFVLGAGGVIFTTKF